MKYKKILAIAAVIVVLVSCFTVPSLAFVSSVDSEGWNVVTQVDTLYAQFPGVTNTYTDVNLPFWTFLTASNTSPFTGFIQLELGGENGNYIPIDADMGIQISFYFRYAQNGTLLPVQNAFGHLNFFDESNFHVSSPISVSIDDTGKYWVYTCNYRNTTGKLIYLEQFTFRYGGNAVVGSRYDVELANLKYKIVSGSDMLANGWVPSPDSPSGSGTVDQQTQLEDQILNDTSYGREVTNGILNSAPSVIGNYTDGFLFLSGLFDLAVDLPFIEHLLGLSLTFGLFIFIFNLVPSVAAKVTRNEIRNERRLWYSKK